MYSPRFWANHFRHTNIPRLQTQLAVLRDRLLPTFENLGEEAEAKVKEAFAQITSRACGEDGPEIDGWDASEMAREAGLEHYMALSDARQTLINSFAVAVYHLWEQQVLSFYRRELLAPRSAATDELIYLRAFRERLLVDGVDVAKFTSWPDMLLFRDLANAVKHAEGRAAEALRKRKPEWFSPPSFRNDEFRDLLLSKTLYEPLAGEDLYVDVEALESLVQTASDFWEELAIALDAATHRLPD
jgi:hypothetical protein